MDLRRRHICANIFLCKDGENSVREFNFLVLPHNSKQHHSRLLLPGVSVDLRIPSAAHNNHSVVQPSWQGSMEPGEENDPLWYRFDSEHRSVTG